MEWRASPSFPEYEVSEDGSVRRLLPGRGAVVGRVLKPFVRSDGYRMYTLRRNDGRHHHRKAHQLVAEAFIGPRPSAKHEVCHGDGSRTNDHWTNLRWGTSAENKADMIGHGTRMMGAKNANARLTECDVAAIRERAKTGAIQRVLAAEFGIAQSHVSRILHGVRRPETV